MITIKLPYTLTNSEDAQTINNLRQQYSCVVRFAYNRFKEGLSEIETRKLCRELKNVELLNSWFVQCAIKEGKQIHTRNKDTKVIFGGKKLFELRLKGKITKEEFQQKRLSPLNIQGEILHQGNRSFDFSQLTQNKLKFKVNRKCHIEISILKQRKNYQKKLELIETLTSTKDLTVSVRLNENFIYLSYEEPKPQQIQLLENRYMGIDLNPNHIGISIYEDDKVIHTQSFDFSKLTSKITSEKNSSDSKRFKYLNNKLKHETIQCAKVIANITKNFKCKFVFLEDLNKIDTSDSGLSHCFNRLTRNLWKRGSFEGNLKKRLQLIGVKTFNINPAYSSFIGNLQHDYFDPCNAACEIGRRGYDVIIKKNKKFYPDFNLKNSIANLWKEYGLDGVKEWKEAFKQIKNSKLRYRVPLETVDFERFKMFSNRSRVEIYKFCVI